MKWILFHQFSKKSCNYFTCSNCGKNIKTGHLFNLDFLYAPLYDPLVLIIALFIFYYSVGVLNMILLILAYIIVYIILFLGQQYVVPLELSIETKCEQQGLTRVQAFFALLLMGLIIFYTLYELLIKPLVLKQSIFT